MRCAIGTDQACAVKRKHHWQVLQRHVMNQLVVAALQECRVDSHHGLKALAGHSGRKCDCMLLGNAYIVITLGKSFMKLHHARALPHGGGDADQAFVVLGHVAQPLAKHLGECLLGR